MRRDLERQLRGEILTLQAELHQARRDLERVVAQRDELRRVIGNVRSYARQEAERAVADNLSRRDAANRMAKTPFFPDYLWRSPDGDGWVDAWNGWYPALRQALEESAGGGDRPWVLQRGEGIVDEEEMERRLATHPKMRPTVALAAHLSDPEPPERPPALDACYHPAEDFSSEGFWHRCHGNHKPCAEVHPGR